MKHRDLLLISLPATLFALALLTGALLFAQYRAFKHSTLSEARETLAQQTHFIAQVLLPDLRAGNQAAVAQRLAFFAGKALRVTVIAPDGAVVADSDAPVSDLPNHAARPEVSALASPAADDFTVRYSTTSHAYLLYHAIRADHWIVRSALPLAAITSTLEQMRQTVALALLCGAGLALLLLGYLLLRVRPQFIALQRAAVAIARGKLETPITPPEGGPLRELAQAVASMGRQLRTRIDQLRRERNEFDALFNTMREPLLLIAHSGEVLRANRAASHLFGAGIRVQGFRIERTASAELVNYVRTAFNELALSSREIPFDDGMTARTLLAHAVRMERDGELCLLLVLTDLTDLRRLESFRSDFVANVSHEIKTPLTAILSTVETLRETELDASVRVHCLDILERQSRRLNTLVRDILSLAAIERRQGAPEQDFRPCNLAMLCRSAAALVQDEAERVDIPLRLTLADETASLRGDPRLLEQAIVNLLTNALRYAAGTTRIDLSLTLSAGAAHITVRDYGCGIPAEHLPRLFERFYRVDKDRSREKGGTGLGLAIVKHTALLHHGSVAVDSTLGEGSTFTLTLPL